MKRLALLCLLCAVLGGRVCAQGGVAAQTFTPWRTVGGALYAVPGATITVCSANAAVTNGICAPAENDGSCCFTDATLLAHIGSNPFTADGTGNVPVFFAAPGTYQVSVSGSGLTAKTYPVTVAGTGGGNVVLSGNNPFTGPNSFAGPTTLTGPLSTAITSNGNITKAGTRSSPVIFNDTVTGGAGLAANHAFGVFSSVTGAPNAEIDTVHFFTSLGRANSGTHPGIIGYAFSVPSDLGGTATSNGDVALVKVESNMSASYCSGCTGGEPFGLLAGGPTGMKSFLRFISGLTGVEQFSGDHLVNLLDVAGKWRLQSVGGDRIVVQPSGATSFVNAIRIGDLALPSVALDVVGAGRLSTSLSIAGGTVLTTTNQTGAGNLVLATSPTITTPAIATGVSQGSGFKHQRFGGVLGGTCPTAAAIGAACTSGNLNWTSAFADNSYTVTCSLVGTMTGQPHIVNLAYQAAGAGITVTIAADTAVAANVAAAGFVDCTATHD